MICLIIFCLNCIQHGRNATYEPGLRIFSCICANECVRVHNRKKSPQAKLFSEINVRFLLNEHGHLKVIPRKLKLPTNFFLKLSPNVLYQALFRKSKTKMIGYYARLRNVMGQSYSIYAYTRANNARYSSIHVTFCGSSKYSSSLA